MIDILSVLQLQRADFAIEDQCVETGNGSPTFRLTKQRADFDILIPLGVEMNSYSVMNTDS